jgi:hypothetical protein
MADRVSVSAGVQDEAAGDPGLGQTPSDGGCPRSRYPVPRSMEVAWEGLNKPFWSDSHIPQRWNRSPAKPGPAPHRGTRCAQNQLPQGKLFRISHLHARLHMKTIPVGRVSSRMPPVSAPGFIFASSFIPTLAHRSCIIPAHPEFPKMFVIRPIRVFRKGLLARPEAVRGYPRRPEARPCFPAKCCII